MQMHTVAFTGPGAVTSFAMWDALTDISRLLERDGLPDSAALSGVRHILQDRLPPMSSPHDWPPARLAPGSTAADAAGMIAGLLAWNPGPATALFTALAGTPVTIRVTGSADLRLAATEAADLDASPGDDVWERDGMMMAGDVPVARTRLLLVPFRVPSGAMEAIVAGRPAGEVLAPYGMRRGRREVSVSRADATVDASAVLSLGDLPVGCAWEHVTERMCAHVAAVGG